MAPQPHPYEQLIPAVQAMLETYPEIDVYVQVGAGEVAMDAPDWIRAAAGQWLHERLGGAGVHVGAFVRAVRRLPQAVSA
jgi:hypothetical protein